MGWGGRLARQPASGGRWGKLGLRSEGLSSMGVLGSAFLDGWSGTEPGERRAGLTGVLGVSVLTSANLPGQSPPSAFPFTVQSYFSAFSCKYYSTFPPFEFPLSFSSHLFLFFVHTP